MSRWIITAIAGVATAALLAGGATAASKKDKPAAFRQVLAAKLGKELNKPAADVLVALKAARTGAKAADKGAKRDAWTAAFAKSLGVSTEQTKSAVRALVKQRLDSLVEDGWLTQEQAAKREDKLWIGFLRLR